MFLGFFLAILENIRGIFADFLFGNPQIEHSSKVTNQSNTIEIHEFMQK